MVPVVPLFSTEHIGKY